MEHHLVGIAVHRPQPPGAHLALTAAIGAGALGIDHVGSTAVFGLAAKPIVDTLVVVADSADGACHCASGFIAVLSLALFRGHEQGTAPTDS